MDYLPQSVACSECDAIWFSRLEGNTASACLFFSLWILDLGIQPPCFEEVQTRPHGKTHVEMNWSPQLKAIISCQTLEWMSIQMNSGPSLQVFQLISQMLWRRDKTFLLWSIKIPDLCKPGEIIHDCCYFNSLSFRVICYTAKITRTPL